MRATISFEIDVKDVEETMGSLASMQVPKLNAAIESLEVVSHRPLRDEISEAITLVQGVASQLQQYHDMLISFEQAKFKTLIPQTVQEASQDLLSSPRSVLETTKSMEEFDGFLENMNREELDDPQTEEG
jgi:hypothetical protein